MYPCNMSEPSALGRGTVPPKDPKPTRNTFVTDSVLVKSAVITRLKLVSSEVRRVSRAIGGTLSARFCESQSSVCISDATRLKLSVQRGGPGSLLRTVHHHGQRCSGALVRILYRTHINVSMTVTMKDLERDFKKHITGTTRPWKPMWSAASWRCARDVVHDAILLCATWLRNNVC